MRLNLHHTYGLGSFREQFDQTVQFVTDPGIEDSVINLYPQFEHETMEGFGGAVTDSAGYIYSLMTDEQRAALMDTYFSPDHLNYHAVRVPMDSCDFSLETYEAMSDPADTELKSFSFAREGKYILPMLEDARAAAEKYGKTLELMLSPWSPPAFMKTNGERAHGGSLKKEYYGMWAEYLCRYIEEFRKRGFFVKRMSIQNEPKAVQTWDSCVYTAEEEKTFLRDFLRPAMSRHGLDEVEIFIWDHNKERVFERMAEICDEKTKKLFDGIAFHWYSGDHFEALDLVRREYPDKQMIISESCIENNKFGGDDQIGNAQRLCHEMMGDLNHGMTAFYDWNMLLDQDGGPNWVGNFCQAPFLFDTKKKVLMPQLILQYFEHISKHLVRGSRRIDFSKYTDALDVTSWKRPDGKIVLIVMNRENEAKPVNVRLEGQAASFVLFPKSIASGVLEPDL